MAVTIERDGWRISGDTAAELKAGIEALREVLDIPSQQPQRPSTQHTVTELQRERQSVSRTVRSVPHLDRAGAAGFLEVLRNSGRDGLTSDDLKQHFEVTGSRALGAKLEQVGGHLADAGFIEEDYLVRTRTRDGRRYKPGARIEEALQAMRT